MAPHQRHERLSIDFGKELPGKFFCIINKNGRNFLSYVEISTILCYIIDKYLFMAIIRI